MKKWAKSLFRKKGNSDTYPEPACSSFSEADINCSVIIEGEKKQLLFTAMFFLLSE